YQWDSKKFTSFATSLRSIFSPLVSTSGTASPRQLDRTIDKTHNQANSYKELCVFNFAISSPFETANPAVVSSPSELSKRTTRPWASNRHPGTLPCKEGRDTRK